MVLTAVPFCLSKNDLELLKAFLLYLQATLTGDTQRKCLGCEPASAEPIKAALGV